MQHIKLKLATVLSTFAAPGSGTSPETEPSASTSCMQRWHSWAWVNKRWISASRWQTLVAWKGRDTFFALMDQKQQPGSPFGMERSPWSILFQRLLGCSPWGSRGTPTWPWVKTKQVALGMKPTTLWFCLLESLKLDVHHYGTDV